MKYSRKIDIVNRVISSLKIDLSDKTIITEVGSNNYLFAPIIPALSNAKHVVALAKDSSYGTANDIISDCKKLISALDLEGKVTFYQNEIPSNIIASVDVITNSGNLRPLDKEFLSHAKTDVVIPLMYEKWEFRDSDIDLNYCKNNGIKVGGTWENHPDLRIFDYVGPLAAKMILEAGYEVFQNKIIVWSDDHFGEVISSYLSKMGADCLLTTNKEKLNQEIANTDLIFICDYDEKGDYSKDEVIDFKNLLEINNGLGLVHLYGKFDLNQSLDRFQNFYPEKEGKISTMSFTLDHVGDYPGLALLTAGYKVAECMLKNEESELVQPL